MSEFKKMTTNEIIKEMKEFNELCRYCYFDQVCSYSNSMFKSVLSHVKELADMHYCVNGDLTKCIDIYAYCDDYEIELIDEDNYNISFFDTDKYGILHFIQQEDKYNDYYFEMHNNL